MIQNTIFLPDNNGFLERFINKKTELKKRIKVNDFLKWINISFFTEVYFIVPPLYILDQNLNKTTADNIVTNVSIVACVYLK